MVYFYLRTEVQSCSHFSSHAHAAAGDIVLFRVGDALEVALSGFMVPANNPPGIMRALSYVSSVRHYTVVLRGVMLCGAGLGSLSMPGLVLSGIVLTMVMLSCLRLRLGLTGR